jgi:hypothetical protein
MCFKIANTQTPWVQTTVYKVMVVTDCTGDNLIFRSPHYHQINELTPVYAVGDIISSHSDEYTEQIALHESLMYHALPLKMAKAGIYVFSIKDDARRYAYKLVLSRCVYGMSGFVILECEVDPTDFLYHDTENMMATYKNVRFTKNVNFFRKK